MNKMNESILGVFGITYVQNNSNTKLGISPIQISDTELFNSISAALGINEGSILLKSNQSPDAFVRDKNGMILSLIRDEKGRFAHCNGFQLVDQANTIEKLMTIFNNQILKMSINRLEQEKNYMLQYFNNISNQLFDLLENDKKDDLITIKESIDEMISEIDSILKSTDRRKAYIEKMVTISDKLRLLSKYFLRKMIEVASRPVISSGSCMANQFLAQGVGVRVNELIYQIIPYQYICQVIIEEFEKASCFEFILGKEVTLEEENIVITRIQKFKTSFDRTIKEVWNILNQKQIFIPNNEVWNQYVVSWANNDKWSLNGFAESLKMFQASEAKVKETFEFARELLGENYIEIIPSDPIRIN